MDALLLLRIYNRVYTVADFCTKNLSYIWTTLVNAYTTKTHLFFQGVTPPYGMTDVHVGAPSSALPLWYYNKDTQTFVQWNMNANTLEDAQKMLNIPRALSLPILSMSIVDGDRVIHDLTDFLMSVRVYHSSRDTFPSMAHLLGAWSLSSRIVLNPANNYSVNCITDTADSITLRMDSQEYIRPVQAVQAIPEVY